MVARSSAGRTIRFAILVVGIGSFRRRPSAWRGNFARSFPTYRCKSPMRGREPSGETKGRPGLYSGRIPTGLACCFGSRLWGQRHYLQRARGGNPSRPNPGPNPRGCRPLRPGAMTISPGPDAKKSAWETENASASNLPRYTMGNRVAITACPQTQRMESKLWLPSHCWSAWKRCRARRKKWRVSCGAPCPSPNRRQPPPHGLPCASADPRSGYGCLFSTRRQVNAHLTGPIAAALMARAADLLASPVTDKEKVDVLAGKLPCQPAAPNRSNVQKLQADETRWNQRRDMLRLLGGAPPAPQESDNTWGRGNSRLRNRCLHALFPRPEKPCR